MKSILKKLKDSIIMDDPTNGLTEEETKIIESLPAERSDLDISTGLRVDLNGVELTDKINEKYDDLSSQISQQSTPDYMMHDTRVVGYTSREEQELLFRVLTQIGVDPTLESILDVGCGVGDLNNYLTSVLGAPVNYLGIDINPNMVNTAYQKYPGIKCLTKDLADMEDTFDFVVSSGLFGLKLTDHMYAYLYKSIDKMYELANIGVAFNMMSDNSKDQQEGLFYYTPTEVFDYCLNKYGKVTMRHDYLEDDFTIYILK